MRTVLFLLVVFVVAILAFALKTYGRMYLFNSGSTGIWPFLADVGPSFLYGFGIVLTLLAFQRIPIHLAVTIGMGAVAYEFLQIFMPKRTFTWSDVGATIIGVACALAVDRLVPRKQDVQESSPERTQSN